MPIHTTIASLLDETIPSVLWEALLKGTALILLAGAATLLMRHCSAALRHLVWLLTLAAFVLLPFGAATFPAWRILPTWSAPDARPMAIATTTTAAAPLQVHHTSSELPAVPVLTASDTSILTAPEITGAAEGLPVSASPSRPLPWLGLAWFAGMALLTLRLVASHLLLSRTARRALRITTGPIANSVQRAATQLKLQAPPRVFLDSQDRIPMVWGIWHPKLLLPAQAASWDDERLDAVLLHELAHVRRRDMGTLCFAQVVCAFFWFHPLVWLAAWRLRMESEQASDDLVIQSGMRSSTYAEHLLHLATHLATPRSMHASGLAMARPSQLETRLHAILESRTNRRRVSLRHAILTGVFTLTLLIPLSMLQAAEQKDTAPTAQPQSTPPAPARDPASIYSSDPEKPWTTRGHVTEWPSGRPLEGVEIWVHAGMGSLFRTGVATTDKDGHYKVTFGRGVMMPVDTPNLQVVNITAHKPGWYEINLNKHGAGAGALRAVTEADLESYGVTADRLLLPDKPRTVNFEMRRATKLRVTLKGTGSFPNLPPQAYRVKDTEKPIAGHTVLKDAPLAKWKVWLTGKNLPPGSGVLASAETDEQGEAVFEDVPVGMAWKVQVDTHMEHKEPVSQDFILGDDKEHHLELLLSEDQKDLSLTSPEKPTGTTIQGTLTFGQGQPFSETAGFFQGEKGPKEAEGRLLQAIRRQELVLASPRSQDVLKRLQLELAVIHAYEASLPAIKNGNYHEISKAASALSAHRSNLMKLRQYKLEHKKLTPAERGIMDAEAEIERTQRESDDLALPAAMVRMAEADLAHVKELESKGQATPRQTEIATLNVELTRAQWEQKDQARMNAILEQLKKLQGK
ncbi:M56 family metallopeptidase [Roseimicrobium gellanilyticum]|nr:M56 family metallopeptidase [Roseimicrobium gellanilyticum]